MTENELGTTYYTPEPVVDFIMKAFKLLESWGVVESIMGNPPYKDITNYDVKAKLKEEA